MTRGDEEEELKRGGVLLPAGTEGSTIYRLTGREKKLVKTSMGEFGVAVSMAATRDEHKYIKMYFQIKYQIAKCIKIRYCIFVFYKY